MPDERIQPDQPNGSGERKPGGSSASDEDLIAAARLAAEARSDGLPPEVDLPPPDYFPGYVISREIHRGGQGVVYQAVHKTTKRKVAIKVMREGALASARERTRFEREVEILAQLDHPSIVNVLDSGSVEGRFYYVMDYISGSTLDVWISQHDLSVAQVLELFAQVCEAVNAAHLKGVIHRDLKPANVRVDADGRPHIVDFGLARIATGSFSGDDKLMTMTGQFIGSLPWASPEQAQGVPGMIDLRTDVYSLGVMLYQMLTGRFPYQVAGAMRDVLDNILRAEPARPSTVRRQINDEVETIVLKCLSKERERRYQNAGELSRDIIRYLRGEPIEAKRDSGWYVLRKTARRYRGAVGAAAAFLVLLAGFAVAMSVLYGQKSRALDQVAAEAAARREVIDELTIWLGEPDPTSGRGRDVTMRQVADDAARRLDERALEGQPRVEAALRTIIGKTYFGLGEFARAEAHLRRAAELQEQHLGPDDQATVDTKQSLGVVLRNLDQMDEALRSLEGSLAQLEVQHGPSDPRTIAALNNLAQLHKSRRDTAAALELLEVALRRAEAEPGFDAATLAIVRSNYGELLSASGRGDEAEPLLTGSVEILRRTEGDHPQTAAAMTRLADHYRRNGRLDEASVQLGEALAVMERKLDADHPDLLSTRLRLAVLLRENADYPGAIALLQELVGAAERTQPHDSPVLAWYRRTLGETLVLAGRAADARELLESSLTVLRSASHPRAPDAARTLISCYEALGENGRAEMLRAEFAIDTAAGG